MYLRPAAAQHSLEGCKPDTSAPSRWMAAGCRTRQPRPLLLRFIALCLVCVAFLSGLGLRAQALAFAVLDDAVHRGSANPQPRGDLGSADAFPP